MLARWCNEHVKATPHRVVPFPGRERYSVAFFCDPDKDSAEVENWGEFSRFRQIWSKMDMHRELNHEHLGG